MDSIKYQQINKKNQNLTDSATNLVMGYSWTFPQVNDKKNIKIKTKMSHWAQNGSFIPSHFSELNPIENECGEEPTWTWESEGSGVILYEGMVSDFLPGILQTHH